jgi:chemotaxis protein histidine kinase CheA
MAESDFVERIAQIRARFVTKLTNNIQETDAALSRLTGDASDAVDAVAIVYRRFHDICGTAATIGFEATGEAARTIDAILIGPFREQRVLSRDELTKLTEGLVSLRIAARTET